VQGAFGKPSGETKRVVSGPAADGLPAGTAITRVTVTVTTDATA